MSINNELAPIVLFCYNRPWHSQQTLDALALNELASLSDLIVYCDGPKDELDEITLQAIKETLKKETIKYLDIFKDHPYIFNLGHGVLPETDPNMVEYLVNTVREY